MSDCRVKWSAVARCWCADPAGVSIEAARLRYGFRGLPRMAPVFDAATERRRLERMIEKAAAAAERRHEERMPRLAAENALKAAAKKAKRAAARERARVRRKIYFAAWQLRVGEGSPAERREAARTK